MEEAQERLLYIPTCQEEVEAADIQDKVIALQENSRFANWKWWIQVAVYIFFVLAGQAGGTILSRVYYEHGGKSTWIITLTQSAGFPFLIPFLFISPTKNIQESDNNNNINVNVVIIKGSVYVSLGVLLSLCSVFSSAGLQYLPASTYSLLSSTQLAFNALFSFLLNGQKFTPYITNSVVILTFSSVLFVFKTDSKDSVKDSRGDFMLGFLYTIATSACCALMFSLTQLAFQKIIWRPETKIIGSTPETVRETVKLSIMQPLFATVVDLIGVFASGEWKGVGKEMEECEQGVFLYILVLVCTAVSWEAYNVGTIGLTFKVSSLFCNVVIMFSRVIVPFLSMAFLHEELGGLEVVSLLMALWGFASYIYQQYLDEKSENL